MRKSVILAVVGLLFLSSMQIHADAMSRGVRLEGSVQNQSAMKTKSMRSTAPQPALSVALPDTLPENVQCGSVAQPCVEKGRQTNHADKEKASAKE